MIVKLKLNLHTCRFIANVYTMHKTGAIGIHNFIIILTEKSANHYLTKL